MPFSTEMVDEVNNKQISNSERQVAKKKETKRIRKRKNVPNNNVDINKKAR